jgi:hypothetical protein
MAHLVEHCVLHPDKRDNFHVSIAPWISGTLHGEHTYIQFESHVSSKKVLDILKKDMLQKNIDYEYRVFDEEFWDVRYDVRVFEKFAKQLLWEDWSWRQTKYSLAEIKKYHKTYYQKWEYVLIDDDKNIVVEHNIVSNSIKTVPALQKSKIIYTVLYLEGEKNYILHTQSTSYADILYFYFLYDVIKARDNYKKRYVLDSYYYHGPADMYTSQYCALRVNPHTTLDITKKFFDGQKKYFIQWLMINNYVWISALSLLYFHQQYDQQKSIDFISSISFENFIDIITNIKKL